MPILRNERFGRQHNFRSDQKFHWWRPWGRWSYLGGYGVASVVISYRKTGNQFCALAPSGRHSLGPSQQAEERPMTPMTVFVYVNTAKQVGDVEYIKIFATVDAAE